MYRVPTDKVTSTGKRWFLFAAVPLLVAVVTIFKCFSPPEFTACKKGELGPHCICPADPAHIGKRNIILVDVTDKLPLGKAKDVENLIRGVAFPELSLWEWLTNGKKIEKTSVYLLSEDRAVDMVPVATYYSFPPDAAWLFSDLSADKEKKIKENASDHIQHAIAQIASKEGAGKSLIVQSLATITSNADVWMPGSKLILVSDLYENSATCGYFEQGAIAPFGAISPECKRWVDKLGAKLIAHSGENSSKNSTVAICQILSKKQQSGLIAFWKELFQSQLSYDVSWTCEPQTIQARQKELENFN